MTLKNFPRQLVKNVNHLKDFPDKKENINILTNKLKFKMKKNKFDLNDVKVSNNIENIKYTTLKEGMIILGKIFKVADYFAVVSLPGQMTGKLEIIDVSQNYTNLLKNIAHKKQLSTEFKSLRDLYKEGDNLICYVKEVDGKKVSLSLEPHLINKDLNLNSLKKNSKIVVSVKDIEDHGYILDTGLKNFQAFLPASQIETEKSSFFPGKQLICCITDIRTDNNTFIAQVSVLLEEVNKVNFDNFSLNNIIPGTQYILTIKTILSNGLQVCFNKVNTGFVHHLYIKNCLTSFKVGQKVVGTLLYSLPTVKFTYFSLLPQDLKNDSLSIGDTILEAKVVSLDKTGIFLSLTKDHRGFVPLKHTDVNVKKINSIFTTNSIHKCKIIAYDWIARMYICSTKESIIEAQYINKNDLKPGDKVDVTIKCINDLGGPLTVLFGKIKGIVPHYHIADPGSKIKVSVGKKIAARVLETSHKLIFTLKKSLVQSILPVISKLEDAKVGTIYDGSVLKISNHGVLIQFFGNLKGWIPKYFLRPQELSQKSNLCIGQTMPVIIKSICIDQKKIILSPLKSEKTKKSTVNVGDIVEGTVIDSSSDGVFIRLSNDEGNTGFLPAGHMSLSFEVGKLLAAKTIIGDRLSAVVFSTKPDLILSTTLAPEKVFKIHNLQVGQLVLCSVKNMNKNIAKVILPIDNCSKYGEVFFNDLENNKFAFKHQILFGKVVDINKSTQDINLTTLLSKVWNSSSHNNLRIITSVDVLSSYLSKISELSKNIYYTSKPISNFKLGQQIKGVVEKITDSGLVLKLTNNVKGIVSTGNFLKSYEQNDEVTGTVLWINYPNECIEITLISHVINSVNSRQNNSKNIPIGAQLRGEIVLINNWFILVVLKGSEKGILVALPARRHLNDTVPNIHLYQIGAQIKCYGILNKKEHDTLLPICMIKSTFESLNFDVNKLSNSLSHMKRKWENVNVTSCKSVKKFKK